MMKAILFTATALAAAAASAQPVERKFSDLFDQRSTATDIIVQVSDDEVLVFDGQADGKVFQVRGRTLYVIAKRSRVDGTLRLVARDQVVAAGNPDLVTDKSPFDQPAGPGPGGPGVDKCRTGNNGGPGNPGAPGGGGDPGKTGSSWVVDIETLEGDGTLELLNVGGHGGKGQQGQTGGKGGQAGRGGDAKALPPNDCGGFDAGQPGDGGPGGTGGLGGPGGQGGKTFLSPSLQKGMSNRNQRLWFPLRVAQVATVAMAASAVTAGKVTKAGLVTAIRTGDMALARSQGNPISRKPAPGRRGLTVR